MSIAVNEKKETASEGGPVAFAGDSIDRFREALHEPNERQGLARHWRRFKGPVAKIVKVAAAVLVLAVVGWQPLQRLLVFSSVEAVVNARLVTLRAPIDGEVRTAINLVPGAKLAAGEALLKVTDARADRGRLDDLSRQRGEAEEERTVTAARLTALVAERDRAETQLQSFLMGRRAQLDRRLAELEAQRAAAIATHDERKANRDRTASLARLSASSQAQLDRAVREEKIAAQEIVSVEKRIAVLEVERDVLQAGHFLGDAYNDVPRTAERLAELRQRIAEQEAELRARDARIARLDGELSRERERYMMAAEAEVRSPRQTSVWEMLTAPGEQVRRGQDLARLLDCETPIVTASVSEAVYNRLVVGAPARVHLKDSAEELEGHVVQLAGQASAPANLAIAPAFLQKEAYRVTVAVPALASPDRCPIGRTGRVTFDISTGAGRG